MKNRSIEVLNIVTVASIFFTIIFMVGSFPQTAKFAKSFGGWLFLFAYIILSGVGFWGSLIQGIRSLSNGKPKTMVSASVYQLILFISHLTFAWRVIRKIWKTDEPWKRNIIMAFAVVFVIMIAITNVKMSLAKKLMENDDATEKSKLDAKDMLKSIVIYPIVTSVSIVVLSEILGSKKNLVITILVLILGGFITVVVSTVVSEAKRGGSTAGGYYSETPTTSYSSEEEAARRRAKAEADEAEWRAWKEEADAEKKAKKEAEAARRQAAEDARAAKKKEEEEKRAIAKELDDLYCKEFKRITNEPPWLLDRKVMKDGPERDAVLRLTERMQREAAKKGVKGKTKWF